MLPIPENSEAGLSVRELTEILVGGLGSGDLEVPALNTSVVRLLELCRDPDYDVEPVAAVIERDPALAARILRVTNSAIYAPVVPIDSVEQAVSRMGARALSEIALSLMLKNEVFSTSGQHAKRIQQLWEHSAVAGIYAKNIAILLRGHAQSSMLEGLLHDVGRPIVICMLEDIETCIGEPLPSDLFEEVIDELHCEIGALLVRQWRLPSHLETAVSLHHRPFAISDHRDASILTHLADELAHWAVDPSSRDEGALRGHLAIRHLGLTPEQVEQLFADPDRVRSLAACF